MAFLKFDKSVLDSSSVEALVYKSMLPENVPFLVERTALIRTKYDSGAKSLKLKIKPFKEIEEFPKHAAIIAPQRIKTLFYEYCHDKKKPDEGVSGFQNFIIFHVGLEQKRVYEDKPYTLIDFLTLEEILANGDEKGMKWNKEEKTKVFEDPTWQELINEIVSGKCKMAIENEKLLDAIKAKQKLEGAKKDFDF